MTSEATTVTWLDRAPAAMPTGGTFTVPWPKGELAPGEPVRARTADGEILPVQPWSLAYWPEGSAKCLALATIVES